MLTRMGLLALILTSLLAVAGVGASIIGGQIYTPQVTLPLSRTSPGYGYSIVDLNRSLIMNLRPVVWTEIFAPPYLIGDGSHVITIATSETGRFGLHRFDLRTRQERSILLDRDRLSSRQLSVSPNSRHLVFQGHIPGQSRESEATYLINLHTMTAQEIWTMGETQVWGWSSDSQWVALRGFVQNSTQRRLILHDLATGTSEFELSEMQSTQTIGFSSDFRYLLSRIYDPVSADDVFWQVINLTNNQTHSVQSETYAVDSRFEEIWLDSEHILSIVNVTEGNQQRGFLWIKNLFSHEERLLDTGHYEPVYPSRFVPSPNRDRIAVVGEYDGEQQLLLVDATSSQTAFVEVAEISDIPDFMALIWSPDGAHVAYSDRNQWTIQQTQGQLNAVYRGPVSIPNRAASSIPAVWLDARHFAFVRYVVTPSGLPDAEQIAVVIVDVQTGDELEIILEGWWSGHAVFTVRNME